MYNSKLNVYEYFSVPNLSQYYEVAVYGYIGECVCQMRINKSLPYESRNAFISVNYNGTIQIYADFANNKIAIKTINLNGWDYSQVHIVHIVGLSKA